MPIENFASEMPIRFLKVHEFLLFIIDLRVRARLHNQAAFIQSRHCPLVAFACGLTDKIDVERM